MKKLAIIAIALLACVAAQAQQVRANYRVEGMTHIATKAEDISFGTIPGQASVELVGFPDGSTFPVRPCDSGARVMVTLYWRVIKRADTTPRQPNRNPMRTICFQCLSKLLRIPVQSISSSSS